MKVKRWRGQICHKAPHLILLFPPHSHYSPKLPDLPTPLQCLPEQVLPATLSQKTQQFCVKYSTSSCCGRLSPSPTTVLWPLWESAQAVLCPSFSVQGWVSPGRLQNPHFLLSSASPDTAAQPGHMQGVAKFQWEGISEESKAEHEKFQVRPQECSPHRSVF